MPHFLHSSVNGNLCCFHFFAIVNNATMSILMQIFETVISFPLDIYLVVELVEHMIVLFLIS